MTSARPLDAATLRQELARIAPEARERPSDVRVARGPGRVNLIGEHTDYNDGFVLPAAIDLETWICFVPTDDGRVELTRLDTDERAGFELAAPGSPRGSWVDYVAGTALALAERGVPLHGLRGVIASTLPISAGLSSSAALELASAWALAERLPPLPTMELALAAQEAENRYVGVQSGIMDQFASAHGRSDAALFLDCRSLEYAPVPLPLDRCTIVVCDSSAPRELASSAYNQRRAECERAVAVLARDGNAVASLRDADLAMVERAGAELDDDARRRAVHVISENARVLETRRALADGDLATVGRLFGESHASLRDLYEVSSFELDTLVGIAASTPGVLAARLTGAGFGGCTVNLVEPGAEGALEAAVAERYQAATGRVARVWAVQPADGAGMVADA